MYCSRCGNYAEDSHDFCPYCGNPLDKSSDEFANPEYQDYQHARSIDYVIHPPIGDDFVDYREAEVGYGFKAPGIYKNKWVAFGLCLFLGVIGAHKFYEGRIGKGILYLFTGGLFGIGWLVDLLVLLTKPTEYIPKGKHLSEADINQAYYDGFMLGKANMAGRNIRAYGNTFKTSGQPPYSNTGYINASYGGRDNYNNYGGNNNGQKNNFYSGKYNPSGNFEQAKVSFEENGQGTFSAVRASENSGGAAPVNAGWYLAFDKKSTGPYDFELVKKMITDGVITGETLVWRAGMENWCPAGQCAELGSMFLDQMLLMGKPPVLHR